MTVPLYLKSVSALKRIACAILMLTAVGVYQARAAESEAFSQYLAQWMTQPSLTFNKITLETAPLKRFYEAQQYQAFWVDGSSINKRAQRALDVIAKAEEEGLNSALYNVHTIRRIAALNHGNAEERMQVRLSLELLISHAIMSYANDMHTGTVRPQWNTGKTAPNEDEQLAMLVAAAATKDTAGYLAALTPKSAPYMALKRTLKQHQAIAAKGGWPAWQSGKPIKQGMSDARVTTLASILTLTGDMKAKAHGTIYDAPLVTAVESFQDRHGLEVNGIVDSATQQALAVPVTKRIEQIAMTMERMRWMPQDLGSRYVVVNIPGYELRGVNGNETIAMDVIVGKPNSRTPMFSKEITDVVLNPSWGVPPKIALNEMLPKIRNNPDYLTNAGYHVTSNGQRVDPSEVDWESVGRGNFNYAFRQPPGSGNALGKVKFTIPNSDNIYLHDTSQRGLFVRAERSMSHGCVRLSNPKAFTHFMLAGEGWSADKIDAAYDSSASRTVAVAPMPVYTVYWTSWVDEAGKTHFARDVYGFDKSLLAAMTIKPSATEDVALAFNDLPR